MRKQVLEDIAKHYADKVDVLTDDTLDTFARLDASPRAAVLILTAVLFAEIIRLAEEHGGDAATMRKNLSALFDEAASRYNKNLRSKGATKS